jgi:hypothetical protein
VTDIVAAHKPEPKFKTDIWDVFNDKPDWSAKSWADLKRLNALVLSTVEKFELLDKSNKKVAVELEKYLHNLEEIQEALGVVESKTLSQRSRKDEFTAEIKEINSKLSGLFKKGISLQSKAGFVESTILKPEHKAKLIDWYGSGWRLLYKATRDGWEATKFHDLCDNKGKTITVVSHTNGAFNRRIHRSVLESVLQLLSRSESFHFHLSESQKCRPHKVCTKERPRCGCNVLSARPWADFRRRP